MSYKPRTAELIQMTDGIELPAPGSWTICAGQRLMATRPWALRASALEVVRGGIDVGDGQPSMTLHLEVRGIDRRSFRLDYTGQLVDADRHGRWSFDGPATVGNRHLPNLRLATTYLGVYNHGAAPVALLQVHVQDRRPRALHGGGPVSFGGRVSIGGQVNAQRSTLLVDAERCRGENSHV